MACLFKSVYFASSISRANFILQSWHKFTCLITNFSSLNEHTFAPYLSLAYIISSSNTGTIYSSCPQSLPQKSQIYLFKCTKSPRNSVNKSIVSLDKKCLWWELNPHGVTPATIQRHICYSPFASLADAYSQVQLC